MRHRKKGRKLGSSTAHTRAMKKNLANSLFYYDRIKTVENRAKEIRSLVDKVITWAKKGDLHSRRLAIAALGNDKDLVAEIFKKAEQGMFQDRQGGYTRIYKLGFRKGDNAPMVIMELCTESSKVVKATQEKKKAAETKLAKGKKSATKKEEPPKAKETHKKEAPKEEKKPEKKKEEPKEEPNAEGKRKNRQNSPLPKF